MKDLPGTEPIWMGELKDLMKRFPHCPHCGSIDLQRNNGLAECDHCLWMGSDHEAGYIVR